MGSEPDERESDTPGCASRIPPFYRERHTPNFRGKDALARVGYPGFTCPRVRYPGSCRHGRESHTPVRESATLVNDALERCGQVLSERITPGPGRCREAVTPPVDYEVSRRYSCGNFWGNVRTSSTTTKFASLYMCGR